MVTWDNVNLKQWYELQRINEYEDDIDKKLAMIAVLCNMSIEEVEGMKLAEINKLSGNFEFLNTTIQTKIVKKWRDYIFVIKLSNFTAGQMIDYLEAAKKGIAYNLHTLLAIMDVGSKKEFEEKEKELLEMPITIAHGIANFFFHKYRV